MELVLKVALFCTNIVPAKRPTMREVVWMLLEASKKKPRDSFELSSATDACEGKEGIIADEV
jgi:hypothetical protein